MAEKKNLFPFLLPLLLLAVDDDNNNKYILYNCTKIL